MDKKEYQILTVVPRLPNGRSIADATEPITVKNVEAYHAPAGFIAELAAQFRGLGFEVIGQSLIGLTVRMERDQLGVVLKSDEKGGYVVPENLRDRVSVIRVPQSVALETHR